MVDIIAKIFEMSIFGSIVIAITILARMLLNKKSKSLIMILWVAVAIRLLCPISIESSFSLFNLLPQSAAITENVKEETSANNTKPVNVSNNKVVSDNVSNTASSNIVTNNTNTNVNASTNIDVNAQTNTHVNNVVNNNINKPVTNTNAEVIAPAVVTETEVAEPKATISIGSVLGIVWAIGATIFLGYTVISYASLRRKLKDAEEVEQNVFESDKIPSPFVFGIVKPRVYIPIGLGETEKKLILTHERIHIKKGDYLSKLLGMLCVCIHWFNPIVWIAFMLFEQDTEMRCDEEVLRELGSEIKEKYSLSLVSFAMRNRDMRYAVLPVSFSKAKFNKNEVTVRVKNLISYRRGSKVVAAIIAVTLVVISTACSLNAKSDDKTSDETTTKETEITETTATEATTEAPEATTTEADETEETTIEETEADDTVPSTTVNKRDANANEWFTLLRAKAEELHGSDNSMLFGFIDVYDSDVNRAFKLATYSGAEGYKYYVVNGGEVQEVAYSFDDIDLESTKPENFLMPYDQFMDFPGFINFTFIDSFNPGAFDMSSYEKTLADGYYSGTLYGFSKDCKYAYMNVGHMANINLSPEECLNLKEGDTVKVDGVSMNVAFVESDFDYEGHTRIGLGDLDNDGKFIDIDRDDDGNISRFLVLNMWGYTDNEDTHLVKVPVSSDAILEVNDSLIAPSDLQSYLSDRAINSDSYAEYTDGGFGFYTGIYVGVGLNPARVVNGEITFMSFYS